MHLRLLLITIAAATPWRPRAFVEPPAAVENADAKAEDGDRLRIIFGLVKRASIVIVAIAWIGLLMCMTKVVVPTVKEERRAMGDGDGGDG